jgi:hypothetical protein
MAIGVRIAVFGREIIFGGQDSPVAHNEKYASRRSTE